MVIDVEVDGLRPATVLDASSPQWWLEGKPVPAQFAQALSSWQLTRGLSTPARCVLTLTDANVDDIPIRGNAIALQKGDQRVFSGVVERIESQHRADGLRLHRIYGADPLAKLEWQQQLAVHSAAPLNEIAAGVFGEANFAIKGGSPKGPRLARQIQWGKSDLSWIADLCAAHGTYFCLHSGAVRMFDLSGSGANETDLIVGQNLFEYTHVDDGARAGKQTQVFASAAEQAQPLTGAAENSATQGVMRALGGGFGMPEAEGLSSIAEADIAHGKAATNFVEGLCEGNADLVPGERIKLRDHAANLEVAATLTRVCHQMVAGSGFVTSFSSFPPPRPQRLDTQRIGLGRVSDSLDPKDAGRVRVTLDAFDDVETDWLNVCFPGAGRGKGFVVAPEKDDQVVVAFPNDNLAQAIVIGAIYGATDLPDNEAKSLRPRPYSLMTADGQSLQLDDHAHAATLRSKGGGLVLDPKKVRLHANTDLEIAAPGKRITITASHIDFRKG